MSAQAVPFVTPEEYLAAERAADSKSEHVSGQVRARSGASREHNAIATNLIAALGTAPRGGPCEVFGSDMREHLLVHQDAPRVEFFEKFDDLWASGECAGLNAILGVPSVGVTVPPADIYERVVFPPAG